MKKIKLEYKKCNYVLKKIYLITLLGLSIQSCNIDQYEVIKGEEPIPTPKALRDLFEEKQSTLTTIINFDAATTLNYTSPKGVRLTINGACLRKNGNPVIGDVKVSYVEIFDKGNMLTANKPTLANTTSGKELLLSGGEFYVQALQNNVKLTLTCGMTLDIPTALTGGTQTGMLPFTGTIDANGDLGWDQAVGVKLLVNQQAAQYSAFLPSFGWFNCDRFSATPGPKTTITTNVPVGYGANAAIFLAVKSIPNSLGKSYGQFPVGTDCYLIFVTEKDGKFRYAIKPQVLTANHQVTFSLTETILGTPSELTTAINALQ